eukprot:768502-Hanusia_phi.AAC.1
MEGMTEMVKQQHVRRGRGLKKGEDLRRISRQRRRRAGERSGGWREGPGGKGKSENRPRYLARDGHHPPPPGPPSCWEDLGVMRPEGAMTFGPHPLCQGVTGGKDSVMGH